MTAVKKTLHEKLVEIQKELKAPKSQLNKFGGFHYRSNEDILEAVKPLNAKHGLVLLQRDELVVLGEPPEQRFYIKATSTLTDGENEISCSAYAREPLDKKGMDSSQITGTASSYARKYSANGLYRIDDSADSDGMAGAGKTPKPGKKAAPKSDERKKEAAPVPIVQFAAEWEEPIKVVAEAAIEDGKITRVGYMKARVKYKDRPSELLQKLTQLTLDAEITNDTKISTRQMRMIYGKLSGSKLEKGDVEGWLAEETGGEVSSIKDMPYVILNKCLDYLDANRE